VQDARVRNAFAVLAVYNPRRRDAAAVLASTIPLYSRPVPQHRHDRVK